MLNILKGFVVFFKKKNQKTTPGNGMEGFLPIVTFLPRAAPAVLWSPPHIYTCALNAPEDQTTSGPQGLGDKSIPSCGQVLN